MAEIAVKLEEEDIRKLVDGVELTFRDIVEKTLRRLRAAHTQQAQQAHQL